LNAHGCIGLGGVVQDGPKCTLPLLDEFYADSEYLLSSYGHFSVSCFVKTVYQEAGGIFSFAFNPKQTFCLDNLDDQSCQVLCAQNAGGTSEVSEALSYDILYRLFGASDLKMEMDVTYYPPTSKKTDYVCTMLGKRCSVSVTRAMAYRRAYTDEDARELIRKKVAGLLVACDNGEAPGEVLSSSAATKPLTSFYPV
jgi:hypothetical protein